MNHFPPTVAELFENFDDLPEWDERYDFIIDLGRELPEFPPELQTDGHIVEGCMSMVWMMVEPQEPGQPIKIRADSDSMVVKGLIVILLAFYADKTAQQIIESDVSDYLTHLGLSQHLSPQRRNGLFSMVMSVI